MVKLIVKAIVKIHKNERKGLIRAIKKILLVETKESQQFLLICIDEIPGEN